MRLLAAGTRLPGWVDAACADYLKRFGSDVALALIEIPLAERGARADVTRARTREGERMLKAIRPADFVVALEAGGQPMSTEELARWLGTRMQDGRDVVLLIGGPDGLAPACRKRADLALSLSPLTFPHALARVIVIEQIYRALSLIRGHPYHRK